MKKIAKLIALILSIAMISALLCGCGKKEVVKTGEEFTYWVPLDANTAQTLQSFNDLMMFKEMEKATGTKVNFIHPSQGSTGSEAFQVLMASGDYPDMIEHWWAEYPGGGDQAIEDGVALALNDYLEEYAPNYYNYVEGDAAKENDYMYKATAITNKGNYFGFKNLNVGRYRDYQGLYIRKDLLDKWKLDIPETIEEWETILETAKENGIKYPLTGDKNLVGAYGKNLFNTAYKVANSFYLEGDTVKFGPFQKDYKKFVEKMADWMKKGYIDIDYVTNDTTIIQGNICNGTSIAAVGYVGGDMGNIIPAMNERQPGFKIAACPIPVMKKGDIPHFQSIQAAASDPTVVVTVQCGIDNEDRYKEAISWCDYLYSDEGLVLKSFGIEGETFTIEKDEDGTEHYVYTDKVTNYEEFGATNMSAALYHFMLPANHPGFNQHPDYFRGYYEYPEQMEAIETWNAYVEEAYKHVLPTLSYTTDEASEKATIESKGKDNLRAAISNIILGKASINTFDDAIKAAKKAGYDRLTEITQDAYNRYKSIID